MSAAVLCAALLILNLITAFGPASLTARPKAPSHPPLPAFVDHGVAWLAAVQLDNGGWGAGSHARQDIRDPHAVQVDPATTAFAALALLRSGSTLTDGPYRDNLDRALRHLVGLVEAVPDGQLKITTLTGTQPQAKLGQHVDASMVAQFFTEILPYTAHDQALERRTRGALQDCVVRLTRTQDADGSWNSQGGWAGVLQSAMANNALEKADAAGVKVDGDVLKRSREYQKGNLDEESGRVRTESAAGISLYSIASNQRATAQEAAEAEQAVRQGAREGRVDAPAVSVDNLRALGYDDAKARELDEAYRKNKAAADLMNDEQVLAGFGNNGGEEFLSYMMTSESLALQGGEAWTTWHTNLQQRLSKIQNPNGSWSGHHCITSPVFCTAAVILALTADRA